MEAINGLNDILSLSSLRNVLFNHRLNREVIIRDIEIVECLTFQHLVVTGRQHIGMGLGALANGCIGVHPAGARGDVQANKILVYVGVRDTQWVDLVLQRVPKNRALSEPKDEHV